MEKKYYKKPDTKTFQLKNERLLQDNSPASGKADSRELRRAWKDED